MLVGPAGLGALTGQQPWLHYVTISNTHAIEPFAELGVVLLLSRRAPTAGHEPPSSSSVPTVMANAGADGRPVSARMQLQPAHG